MNRWRWRLAVMLLLAGSSVTAVSGQAHRIGGSIRGYQFFAPKDLTPEGRNEAELWLLRFTDQTTFGSHVSIEVHGLLTLLSPAVVGTSRVAHAATRNYLHLQTDLSDSPNVDVLAALDRVNVRFDLAAARITVGRQAVSWGVNHFWPALDLFAPFAPEQLDREYKAGIDAVRINLPLGRFSELEVLGGSLGSSLTRDGALGAMLRWNLGSVDVGFMGGKFHGDRVGGLFVTANLRGTGLRGELAYTDSGDPFDATLDRATFWRGALGLDRQLTPSLSAVVEFAVNGYGTGQSSRYPLYFASDRLARGEINGFGRIYSGVSLEWLLSPLWTSSQAVMLNYSDGSLLWVPSFTLSTSDNSDLLLGAQLGLGAGREGTQPIGSEYGTSPSVLFASLRVYF